MQAVSSAKATSAKRHLPPDSLKETVAALRVCATTRVVGRQRQNVVIVARWPCLDLAPTENRGCVSCG